MSEINVPVSGNATPNVKGTTIPKEENSGTDPAAMNFAAIFGGWMAQVMGQGQDSGLQSSSNPAGKEANSGQTGIQGLEGMLGSLRTIAGLNLGSVNGQDQQDSKAMMKVISPEIMTLLSQNTLQGDVTDSGMGSGQLQTGKLPLSELDQYRVLITQLLQDMSGEISKVSIKPVDVQGLLSQLSQELNLNTSTTKPNIQSTLGQLLQEILMQNTTQTQSQPTNAQPEANASQIGLLNKASEQVQNTVQNANLSNTQTGLQTKPSTQIMEYAQNSNLNSEKAVVQAMPLNRNLTQNLNQIQDISLGQTQNGAQAAGLPTGNHLLQMNIQTETGQNDAGNEKYNFSGNGNITNSKDAGTGDTNSNVGNFNLANLTMNSASEVENKAAASPNLPVWRQVAQELQAKVLNQLPTVRELNIQLHPAELGQISISLSWNNGQVNMHMLASKATGQILQNNFAELRESLSQSGVQCGMMQMGFADSNQDFNQSRNQTFSSQSKNQDKQESNTSLKFDDVRLDVLPTYGLDRGLTQNNRINVTA